MIRYKASEKTRWYAETCSDVERAAIMFYVLEGWETGWAYPDRPGWLKSKYPDEERLGLKPKEPEPED